MAEEKRAASEAGKEGQSELQDPEARSPLERDLEGVVFLVLSTRGDDPAPENWLGLQALAISRNGSLDRLELGLEDVSRGAEFCWSQLEAFARGQTLLVPDVAEYAAWCASLEVQAGPDRRPIGLDQVAALLRPGRLAQRPSQLLKELTGRALEPGSPDALRHALTVIGSRFLGQGQESVHATLVALATAASRLHVSEPGVGAQIGRILSLLQSIDQWRDDEDAQPGAALQIESDSVETEFLTLVLSDAEPRWQSEAKAWHSFEPLPPHREEALPFTAEDEALLDVAFKEHLPALFSEEQDLSDRKNYRESQHTVSTEVAANFGHQSRPETQLLLVHAPTGTGKTLAYLLPALLWSKRHSVRVGISTYTRALQEQAIDREVPRAQELLRRAGAPAGARVSMLKGRENYLCWRTLKLHVPSFEASGEQWLAFAQLLAFSMCDPEGDLDRLPRQPPVALEHSKTYRATLSDLLRQVRARTSCCRAKQDKVSCAAEVARWRAERSHQVITNHSFALARQEFFRHLIFDECEHLHDQAHSAWSHHIGFQDIATLLDRLYKPEQSRARSLFVRVAKRIVAGTPSWDTLDACRQTHEALHSAFEELRFEAGSFDSWRKSRSRERDEREDHSLLREYAEGDLGRNLIVKRQQFCHLGNQLDERLAELAERLEKQGAGRMARLRRTIDLARTDLVAIIDAIGAWLPLQEGKPCFNSRTFNDVEVDTKGELQLSARVLLPNEYLGRFYYPQLSTASFLSATTFLQGGFDAAISYLGLDRAVETAEQDPDLLCTLRTFRAPEVFDYSRVQVITPRDAPAVSRDKEGFLHYVRDFIADLGERTNGRILALFTNAEDVKRVGLRLEGHFRARRIGFFFQNMPGTSKEEMSDLFRARTDSVLLGVDTFWYGADFPGETLEHLVIVRLPYGVPDRYHHAQCAALGMAEQRRQIYMPRALAKFRQGFGRLMRRIDDRGCVYVLDHRIADPRHRSFLRELPVARIGANEESLATLVRGDTQRCLTQAMIHVGLEQAASPLEVIQPVKPEIERFEPKHDDEPEAAAEPIDINTEDLPF
jgi:Rad3-related DNA helicase